MTRLDWWIGGLFVSAVGLFIWAEVARARYSALERSRRDARWRLH
jgi:hypothetical protein